jgi:GLPGLI family protein
MFVKRFFISISMLFFGALLLQAKNNVIDSGQYLCSYYYCYSKDTIKNDEKGEDLLFLSIGKNVSKCYSYYTYQSDSLQSTEDGKAKFRVLFKEAFKREGYSILFLLSHNYAENLTSPAIFLSSPRLCYFDYENNYI